MHGSVRPQLRPGSGKPKVGKLKPGVLSTNQDTGQEHGEKEGRDQKRKTPSNKLAVA